ncbi:MAG: hypothetical protein ACK5MP_03955 [Nostocoides sp.]
MWFQIPDPADPRYAGHVNAIATRARTSTPRCGAVRIVTIDGPSGAGKTTLARRVGLVLAAPVLHMEAIYPGWDGLAEANQILIREVLRPLAHGEPAGYPTWNWQEHTTGPRVSVPASDLLVIEGCGASAGPAGSYAALQVFLDASPAVRRERGKVRDGDDYMRHWDRWAAQERALFAEDRTSEHADVVLWSDLTGATRRGAGEPVDS